MRERQRKLRRSRKRWLGGVCGGIAEFLGWPPFLVRVLYVVVSGVSVAFPGILVYIVLWVIMPPPAPPESEIND
jgi:phage shock protein PspC (stress-responsive transcriptional regulator)